MNMNIENTASVSAAERLDRLPWVEIGRDDQQGRMQLMPEYVEGKPPIWQPEQSRYSTSHLGQATVHSTARVEEYVFHAWDRQDGGVIFRTASREPETPDMRQCSMWTTDDTSALLERIGDVKLIATLFSQHDRIMQLSEAATETTSPRWGKVRNGAGAIALATLNGLGIALSTERPATLIAPLAADFLFWKSTQKSNG